eukprot:TRINITY_DN5647_c0_g1_i1.p2 TRINITY_DN5647_c0_g1~~TRINITY_DN5647_c0_g1_i1.p2  ORF type:complete len:244 (+),score=72.94 TRINITY_DN5647_c0_g1_i1:81-812(+)
MAYTAPLRAQQQPAAAGDAAAAAALAAAVTRGSSAAAGVLAALVEHRAQEGGGAAAAHAEVCKALLQLRLVGGTLPMALDEAGSERDVLWAYIIDGDRGFIDGVNRAVLLSGRDLPLCLYESPTCLACGAADACVECPHCAADQAGPDAAFFCNQACFAAAWPAHAPQHAASHRMQLRRALLARARRRRLRRSEGFAADAVDVIYDHLPVIVTLVIGLPVLAYFYTFWTRKYFGWGVAYMGVV